VAENPVSPFLIFLPTALASKAERRGQGDRVVNPLDVDLGLASSGVVGDGRLVLNPIQVMPELVGDGDAADGQAGEVFRAGEVIVMSVGESVPFAARAAQKKTFARRERQERCRCLPSRSSGPGF
jgi:hypothetical protein